MVNEIIVVVGPSDPEDVNADVVEATGAIPDDAVPEEYVAARLEDRIAYAQERGYKVRQVQAPQVGRFEDPSDVVRSVDLSR